MKEKKGLKERQKCLTKLLRTKYAKDQWVWEFRNELGMVVGGSTNQNKREREMVGCSLTSLSALSLSLK